MALETGGYLYPYSCGTLSPVALLNSSIFYLVVMCGLPIVVLCNAGWSWAWFLTSCGMATVVFAVVNAMLGVASAGVYKRLRQGRLGESGGVDLQGGEKV